MPDTAAVATAIEQNKKQTSLDQNTQETQDNLEEQLRRMHFCIIAKTIDPRLAYVKIPKYIK